MSTATATAHWDTPQLINSLARRGWGPLDGRHNAGVRDTLSALVSLLPYSSAQGTITAGQVADTAGLSERWTRHCLHELERLRLITWRRGHLHHGQQVPGYIRICKTVLAGIIRSIRGHLDDRREARATATAARISGLRTGTVPPRFNWHRRAKSRPELSSSLTILTDGDNTLPTGSGVLSPLPGFELPPPTPRHPRPQKERSHRPWANALKLTIRHPELSIDEALVLLETGLSVAEAAAMMGETK